MNKILLLNYLLILSLCFAQCGEKKSTDKTENKTVNTAYGTPEWVNNAVIYEVNLRQFSIEGNIKGFRNRLDSVKKLGVDILWFMPLQPIGIKNRKGSLGSYYSVRDYKAINEEFGTDNDFKNLVQVCHEMGFKVIIDWVANHTAWDHKWISEHSDWYTKDKDGNIIPPVADWSDVADLNYDKKEMRDEMISSMLWWVDEFDIDGFRCDVAGSVPTDFWETATEKLNQKKQVFMLAEAEQPDHLTKAFNACYGWELHHILKEIYKGKQNADSLVSYFNGSSKNFPENTIKMNFVANHDENTWNGTTRELFGESEDLMTVLTFSIDGLPLVYNGMEAGLDKRLKFFDKDIIDWNLPGHKDRFEFYRQLIEIRHKNPALWSNVDGQTFTRVFKNEKNVYGFIRQSGENRVLAVFNLSGETVKMDALEIPALEQYYLRMYKNMVTDGEHLYQLGPWGYSLSTWNEPSS
ncbi:MAG: alpha-amylase [Flavobacteriales bacterium]|nr:alpha-amylase [Flavobacteriales bacterium]